MSDGSPEARHVALDALRTSLLGSRSNEILLEDVRRERLDLLVRLLSDETERPHAAHALADVAAHDPELVVLAGFMKLLGAPLLETYGGRILNTHPAIRA